MEREGRGRGIEVQRNEGKRRGGGGGLVGQGGNPWSLTSR